MFFLSSAEQDHDQQNQQDGHGHEGRHDERLDLHGISRDADDLGDLGVFYTMATNQHPVAVDAIGGAGDQGAQIPAVLNEQVFGLMGQDDLDLIHLVGQCLVQNAENKGVPCLQLIQIGEQSCRGQAPVARHHAMGAFAAHRQACPLQMADGDLQDRLIGTMIDRQGDTDTGNLDIAHNAVAADVQKFIIGDLLLIRQDENVVPLPQVPVIGDSGLPHRGIFFGVDVGHLFGIGGDGPRLVQRVPVVGYRGIQYQGQANEEDQY